MISTTKSFTSLERGLSLLAIAAFAFFTVVSAPSALAGSITYTGTVPGPGGMMGFMDPNTGTVWYGPVTESNGDPNAAGALSLFGAPSSVTGNAIDFDPQGFNAQSTGDASQITDSQLSFMVKAVDGTLIDNLLFEERGDTNLVALSGSAFTSVTMFMFIDVLEIDGNPVNFNLPTQAMTFSPSDGDWIVPGDGFPNVATDWEGELFVDVEQLLIDENIPFVFGATKLNITLDNTLNAASSGGGSAFIAKKDFDGLTVTSNVPEPTTALLMLAASVAGLAVRRRA